MALPMYLTLKGQKQGEIKGGVTQKGREHSIRVNAASHSIISPRDAASGLPTGKRQHQPFGITKTLDQATPLLYSALVNNENITEWRLEYWQSLPRKREELVYTVRLINANIASIHHRVQNVDSPDTVQLPVMEDIQFSYQKIEWTWLNGGITAEDDWEAPVV
jgi:type VI secretion system secreted protein Hcp